MKITPLDITQQAFKKKVYGYDIKEVDLFLEVVSSEMEKNINENKQMNTKLETLTIEYNKLKEKEGELSKALLTAQLFYDNIKKNAEKEAEIVVSHAELQADKIMEDANKRLAKIINEIHEMKAQKFKVTANFKAILEAQFKFIEMMQDEITEKSKEKDPFSSSGSSVSEKNISS